MAEKRLLSVDDDEEILAIIREVAVDLGFAVEVLSESARFMTTYVKMKPHVITLDVMMPDLDGIEIIQWLNDVDARAAIIIISGAGPMFMHFGRKLAEVRGSLRTTLLAKPFTLADLRRVLTAAAEPVADTHAKASGLDKPGP